MSLGPEWKRHGEAPGEDVDEPAGVPGERQVTGVSGS